jgi:hypothetical protein
MTSQGYEPNWGPAEGDEDRDFRQPDDDFKFERARRLNDYDYDSHGDSAESRDLSRQEFSAAWHREGHHETLSPEYRHLDERHRDRNHHARREGLEPGDIDVSGTNSRTTAW